MKVLRTLLRPISNSERRRFAVEEAPNIDTTNEDDMDNRSVEEPKVSEVTMLVLVSTRFLVLISFVPLVVETLGGWEEQGEKQIKRIGAALARQTGQDEAVKTRHLFQRLSILLTKGNAALFLNRLPSHPGPDIDGEL